MTIENLDMLETISSAEIVGANDSKEGIGTLEAMERVREMMSARSMAEVARKLGITSQNLNNILKRKRLPFESICRWCNTYGVSINWILFGSGSPKLHEKIIEKDPNSDYLISLLREKIDSLESKIASRKEANPHPNN